MEGAIEQLLTHIEYSVLIVKCIWTETFELKFIKHLTDSN